MTSLPDPMPPRKLPPMTECTLSATGWLLKLSASVGSSRFEETFSRARFYVDRARGHAATPAESALVDGLDSALSWIAESEADSRRLLADSVSGMSAADATEFVEMCEESDLL